MCEMPFVRMGLKASVPIVKLERYFIEPWMLLPAMMRDLAESVRQRGRPTEADASL